MLWAFHGQQSRTEEEQNLVGEEEKTVQALYVDCTRARDPGMPSEF